MLHLFISLLVGNYSILTVCDKSKRTCTWVHIWFLIYFPCHVRHDGGGLRPEWYPLWEWRNLPAQPTLQVHVYCWSHWLHPCFHPETCWDVGPRPSDEQHARQPTQQSEPKEAPAGHHLYVRCVYRVSLWRGISLSNLECKLLSKLAEGRGGVRHDCLWLNCSLRMTVPVLNRRGDQKVSLWFTGMTFCTYLYHDPKKHQFTFSQWKYRAHWQYIHQEQSPTSRDVILRVVTQKGWEPEI